MATGGKGFRAGNGRSGRHTSRTNRSLARSGGRRPNGPVVLGFNALEKLLAKDPDDIVLDLGSERCFPAFQTLLASPTLSDNMMELIVHTLAKACDCNSPQFLNKLIMELPNSFFVLLHLKTFLSRLSMFKISVKDPQPFLESVVKLFGETLKKIPGALQTLPLGDLNQVVNNFPAIAAELKEKVAQLEQIRKETFEKEKRKAELEKQRKNVRRNKDEDVGPPPNNFREMTIIPNKDDISSSTIPYLRRNIIHGRYENVGHYLDVQFRLLREDFLRPLREGINDLILRGMDERRGIFRDIRIYKNVKILHPQCSSKGLQHQIEFDTTRLRRVRWENSKRLIFGSLLCISRDDFQTFFFATVADRSPAELVHGRVTVQFINATHDTQDYSRTHTYQMVETTAYFESYNPILQGLQQTDEEDLPFQKYLVECNKTIDPPKYLERNRFMENAPTFDFTSILDQTSVSRNNLVPQFRRMSIRRDHLNLAGQFKQVPVVELNKWPSKEDLGLDESQFNALQLALTKELAVIQGPPGTGKTYLGLKIAKILLSNKERWIKGETTRIGTRREVHKTPILVICYTNHALDQFLEGIYDFCVDGDNDDKIVRIGGRSKSEKLKDCNLVAIKRRTRDRAPRYVRQGIFDLHRRLDVVNVKMERSSKVLQKCWGFVITENTLKQSGVIREDHFRSLVRPFVGSGSLPEQGSIVLQWLNLATVAAEKEEEQVIGEESMRFHHGMVVDNDPVESNRFWRLECEHGVLGERSFSICVFIKTTLPGCIISSSTDDGNWNQDSKALYIDNTGLIHFAIGYQGVVARSFSFVTDGQWHEVALVYQHEPRRVFLFIDKRMECSVEDIFLSKNINENGFKVGIPVDSSPLPLESFYGEMKNLVYYRSAKYNDKVMGDAADVEYEIDFMQEQRKLEEEDDLFDDLFNSPCAARSDDFRVVFPGQVGKSSNAGWQTQVKKNVNNEVRRQLRIDKVMSEAESVIVSDVWELDVNNRWRLYRKWVREISQQHQNTVASIQEEYNQGMKELQELRNAQSYELLKDAHVIGMTTTGAAKYRDLLHRIKPRITIVEEAAEVLESHIVTALTGGCEHLILIGDHKQLRPKPTVFQLGLDYQLDISLFERMVTNGMPFACLGAQHRMRPEISVMMSHIYNNLSDHESVMNFEHIKGLGKDIFFINHNEKEDDVDENQSHSNAHEARFIGALCNYLIQQDYDPSQITVLTPYSGQLLQLKKFVPKLDGLRISVVDNFQGEENDIILLSLVRSQEIKGKDQKDTRRLIGFLGIENRICVSLSRAKKGFICIGNLNLMKSAHDLWSKILNDMARRGSVGEALPLSCQIHPTTITRVRNATDFNKVPNGGCSLPCLARLECGHCCEQLCHPKDPQHLEYDCRKKCERTCDRGHKCSRMCYQDCENCMVLVEKLIPRCGHRVDMPCHQDPKSFKCPEPCTKVRSCGHKCTKRCGDDCGKRCETEVEKTWPICLHVNKTQCYVNTAVARCKHPCDDLLQCEHPCTGTCDDCKKGRLHKPCTAKCGRVLFCGHECKVPCTKDCPPCSEPCPNKCSHSTCNKPCGDPCVECKERCEWKCEHFVCKRLCGELCDRPRCDKPCRKVMRCGHRCAGLCGELCPKLCRVCDREKLTEIFFGTEDEEDAKFVELTDCGHVFEVAGMDNWMEMQQNELKKGNAKSIQMIKCPKCNIAIRKSLRYGNIIKSILHDIEDVKKAINSASKCAAQNDFKAQIEEKIASANLDETEYPQVLVAIASQLSQSLTKVQQNVIENQIKLLQFIKKLTDIRRSLESSQFSSSEMDTESAGDLFEMECIEKELVEWITLNNRRSFTEQELDDFNEELIRTWILFTYKAINIAKRRKNILLTSSSSTRFLRVKLVLEKEKKLSEVEKEDSIKHLDYIMRKHPSLLVTYQTVTDEEKKMVVKAMGFQQGHWFKCPKGHVYCIGDCGGAMEEAKCPECGSKIGGTQHRLLSDNTLASDMDGARHAAWSNVVNNMRNWIFDD